MEDDLKKFKLEDDLEFFKSSFDVSLGSPTNVRNEVNSNSHYFTTFPGGWGWVGVGGLGGGKYENKANSVSFQLKLTI